MIRLRFESVGFVDIFNELFYGGRVTEEVWYVSGISPYSSLQCVSLLRVVRAVEYEVTNIFNCDSAAMWTGWCFGSVDSKEEVV